MQKKPKKKGKLSVAKCMLCGKINRARPSLYQDKYDKKLWVCEKCFYSIDRINATE